MSATKSNKSTKSSSSASSPSNSITTVSPKAAPKPATKTLFNYFTKLSKDKTENDLNESNRKRKLSAENIQQPPVKILKSSAEVLEIDDNSESAVVDQIVIDDDSFANAKPSPTEEKKPILIKLTPTNKKKNKNSKRKSKGGKSEDSQPEAMEIDESAKKEDGNRKIEKSKIENQIEAKSQSTIEVVEIDAEEKVENNETENKNLIQSKIQKHEANNLELVDVAEIQQNLIDENATLEITSKLVKAPRRKSTRIENSQDKAAEESRASAEAHLSKRENKPSKNTRKSTKAETDSKIIKEVADNHKDVKVNETDNKDVKNSENANITNDVLIVSENNSEGELSGMISPVKNKNQLSQKSNSAAEKKLTPKQLKLQETRRKVREEREKKIQEEREKRQKEKEEQRKKEREEKELKLKREREEKEEQRKKEKAERDEQRAKEREEKERKRIEEINQRNEEKRKREEQKEEEKRKREEERKKKEAEKEEEKREKEQERLKKEQEKLEEEQKKKREADKFKRFFRNSVDQTNPSFTSGAISISSSQGNETSNPATEASSNFMPFCVKGNMKLAPCKRKTLTDDQKMHLEELLKGEEFENQSSYLALLKSQKYVIGKSEKTIPNSEEDDVMIIDDELDTIGNEVVELKPKQQKYRAKYLLFNGNRRPPYYGTWRKKSTVVRPCKPFEMDTKYFNYDVDSDDEWEDDEPGESLKGSDDDYESNDDYEVDNEFFVPHGYLSDEENKAEGDIDGEGGDIEENDNHPATQKAKLKILQQEFFAEHSKKTEKIKPKLIGCIWQNLNEDDDDDKYPAIIHKLLENHAMIMNAPIILKSEIQPPEETQSDNATNIEFTNEEIQVLIKLTHGNVHKRQFLVEEYLASRNEKLEVGKKEKLSKNKISNKIREIAEWKRCVTDNRVMNNRYCWVVKANKLAEFDLVDLDVLNTWKYTLKPLRTVPPASTAKEDSNEDATPIVTTTTSATASLVNSITKYTTPISKLSQSTVGTSPSVQPATSATKKSPTQSKSAGASTSPAANSVQPTKKRINPLMSVPRGQAFSQTKKNTLISEYLNNGKLNTSSNNNVGNVNKSKITEEISAPKAADMDEIISMDCDVIQLD